MTIERYLVCSSKACRFILDMYLDGSARSKTQIAFPTCPQCGCRWLSPPPLKACMLITGPLVRLGIPK